jgi:flavin-dependent dehydrogenase
MTPVEQFDVAIIGGGPAGTSAAITAARRGARVLLLERGRFPRHKVCGEFISPESLALLRSLLGSPGAQRFLSEAPRISCARVFIGKQMLEARIVPPAASLSRYVLDATLWDAARQAGADCRDLVEANAVQRDSVGGKCHSDSQRFLLETSAGSFHARAIVNASGRWSKLSASRPGGKRGHNAKSNWIGLKAHFAAEDLTETAVASTDLYLFSGGYCGVQPVLGEHNEPRVNLCAMVRADVATTLEQVVRLHPQLAHRFCNWQPAMDAITTSPLMFLEPQPIHAGMLQVGDAAGFIDPFVGDGIAIALRSGSLAGELLAAAAAGKSTSDAAAGQYADRYRTAFLPAFRNARRLRRLMDLPGSLRAPIVQALHFPGAAEFLVKKTRSLGTG